MTKDANVSAMFSVHATFWFKLWPRVCTWRPNSCAINEL